MATAEAKERIELPDTPNIRRQFAYLKHMRDRVALAEKALKEMVEAFQLLCNHDFEEVRSEDNYKGFYANPYEGSILIGQKCKKCFFFKPKPEGDPQEICQKCGGKMKYNRIGERTQTITYVCEDCGHSYSRP